MNLRTLKKKCKRAVDILVRNHGYRREDFHPSDGTDTLYAPVGMEKRYCGWTINGKRGGKDFLSDGPLKGTLLYWYQSSYESNEWDCKLPTELLAEIEFWTAQECREMANAPHPDAGGSVDAMQELTEAREKLRKTQ